MDTLNSEILKQIESLSIPKKKAILKLIKSNSSKIGQLTQGNKKQWKNELLNTSVWDESDIEQILQGRKYINQ